MKEIEREMIAKGISIPAWLATPFACRSCILDEHK
jgi:hypothetical protein